MFQTDASEETNAYQLVVTEVMNWQKPNTHQEKRINEKTGRLEMEEEEKARVRKCPHCKHINFSSTYAYSSAHMHTLQHICILSGAYSTSYSEVLSAYMHIFQHICILSSTYAYFPAHMHTFQYICILPSTYAYFPVHMLTPVPQHRLNRGRG